MPYKQVFISHSKEDPNSEFFHKIFSGTNIKSVWLEFEDITPPPASFIRDRINESDAVFVLRSEQLASIHWTRNWVSFEVGLAANLRKHIFAPLGIDIYVFDPADQKIDFPVPYFNYYMPYNTNVEHLKFIRQMINEAPCHYKGMPVRCPYDDCKIEFKLLADVNTFYCPACGEKIQIVKAERA